MTTAYVHATPAHHAFICNSWIMSMRDSDAAGMISMASWRRVMWPEVERVLARPDAVTVVAVNDEARDVYAGFACADPTESPPLVFYAYVKEAYRRQGLATRLLAEVGVDVDRPYRYTCKTQPVGRIIHAANEAAERADRTLKIVDRRDGRLVEHEAEPLPLSASHRKLLHLVSMARWDPQTVRHDKETT